VSYSAGHLAWEKEANTEIPKFGKWREETMSKWLYERWMEGGWEILPVYKRAIFVHTPSAPGAHDDMVMAAALATKMFMDRMPWWKKLLRKIKIFFKERIMKRIAIIFGLTALMLGAAVAQQPPAQPPARPQVVTPKAPYDSDKAQLAVKQETILQLTATADQTAFQAHMKDLQQQYQAEEAKLIAWIADVKKVNAWDDSYTYDRVGDKWTHAPKAEPKPAETPKK
jgi:hypothetical protein